MKSNTEQIKNFSLTNFDGLQSFLKIKDSGTQPAQIGESLDGIFPENEGSQSASMINSRLSNHKLKVGQSEFCSQQSQQTGFKDERQLTEKSPTNYFYIDERSIMKDNISKQTGFVFSPNDQLSNLSQDEGQTIFYQEKIDQFQEAKINRQIQEPSKIEEEFDKFKNPHVTPLIWRKKFFKLLLLSNRFIFKSKKVLKFFHPTELNENQLGAIGDKGAQTFQEAKLQQSVNNKIYQPRNRSHYEKRIRITYLQLKKSMKCVIMPITKAAQNFADRIIQINKCVPLANPFSYIMLLWDFIMMIISLYNLFIIPLQICFDESNEENELLRQTSFSVYLLDILVSMNTSNYFKGELEKRRSHVISNYFKNQFTLDSICIACIEFTNPFGKKLLRLFFILKIIKLSKLLEKNREYFQVDDKYSSLVNLALLMTKIMYLCHLFACFWYKLGRFVQNLGEESWLDSFGGEAKGQIDLYISALYFSAVTITTVGYGDITPKSKYERIFIFCMAFISCANFGYALNQIGSIIQEMNSRQEQYRHNVAILNKYMKEREVTKPLQSKARKYLEYAHSQSEGFSSNQEEIFSKLSGSIQNLLKKEVSLKTLKKVPFLFNKFSSDCLNKLSFIVQEKCYGIGETIIDQFERNPSQLFFILKGEVIIGIKDQQNVKPFKILQSGQIFGEYAFLLSAYQSSFTATSSSFTRVHCISQQEFLSVLEEFPKEKEIFFSYKDRAFLYSDFLEIKSTCFSCKSVLHEIKDCPLLSYHPRKDKLLQKLFRAESLFRSSFSRKNNNRFQTLLDLKVIQSGNTQFLEETKEGQSQESERKYTSHPSLNNLIEQDNSINSYQPQQYNKSITSKEARMECNRESKDFLNSIINLDYSPNISTKNIYQPKNNNINFSNNNSKNKLIEEEKERTMFTFEKISLAAMNLPQIPKYSIEGGMLSPKSKSLKKLEDKQISKSNFNVEKKKEEPHQQQQQSSSLQPNTPKSQAHTFTQLFPHHLSQQQQVGNNQLQQKESSQYTFRYSQTIIHSLLLQLLNEIKKLDATPIIQDTNSQKNFPHQINQSSGNRKSEQGIFNQTLPYSKQQDLASNHNMNKAEIIISNNNQGNNYGGRSEEYGLSFHLDQMKSYSVYFPHNNATPVLLEYFHKYYKMPQLLVNWNSRLNQRKSHKRKQSKISSIKKN